MGANHKENSPNSLIIFMGQHWLGKNKLKQVQIDPERFQKVATEI